MRTAVSHSCMPWGSNLPLFGSPRTHRKEDPTATHSPRNSKCRGRANRCVHPTAQPIAGCSRWKAETYFVFQQVIKGFMVWWAWSIVRASRSQWRAHSWRKRGSLQRQREGAQWDPIRITFFTTVATEAEVVLAPRLSCPACVFPMHQLSKPLQWPHFTAEEPEAQRS